MDNLNSAMEDSVDESSENANQPTDDDEYDSDNEDFYFESDHLALRGNADYRAVLRTIVILEAQRIEAAKHIDKISQAHRHALDDPEEFLRKLVSKEGLDLPAPINIQNVSSNRSSLVCPFFVFLISMLVFQVPKIKFEKYNMPNPVSTPSACEPKAKEENDLTVRGRVYDQTKPETFNQVINAFTSVHSFN